MDWRFHLRRPDVFIEDTVDLQNRRKPMFALSSVTEDLKKWYFPSPCFPLRLFAGFLARAIVPQFSSCTIICVCSYFSIFPSEFCKLRCSCMVDADKILRLAHGE